MKVYAKYKVEFCRDLCDGEMLKYIVKYRYEGERYKLFGNTVCEYDRVVDYKKTIKCLEGDNVKIFIKGLVTSHIKEQTLEKQRDNDWVWFIDSLPKGWTEIEVVIE